MASGSNGNAPHVELTPTFNLKAVVNETGLKPDTLRAWERRYGLPQPDRTAGGHRLYSQRDIDTIKWLIARQDEGVSISHAVEMWQQLIQVGEDPLQSKKFTLSEISSPLPSVSADGNIAALRQAWIAACLEFDERRANTLLSEAFAIFPVETVCLELLQQGIAEIGRGWYEGDITVQQEHFASALSLRRLESMLAATPPPTRNGRVLAILPPEERHTFALLLITLLLRRSGWDVIYLGANVPIARLEATLDTAHPDLVIISAQTLYTASTMLPMALLLHRERVPVAFGGAVFSYIPRLRGRVPGYFLGEKIEQVTHTVEQLMLNPPPLPDYEQSGREYRIALQHYLDRQAAIEAQVWEQLHDVSEQMYLKNANADFGQNIIAALTFGDMELLSTNLSWLQGLLANYHYRMPTRLMGDYIEAYATAARAALDERGEVILEWLDTILRGLRQTEN